MSAEIKNPINHVLIVEKDRSFSDNIEKGLRSRGINDIKICEEGSTLESPDEINKCSFILLNISLPSIKGKEIATKILENYPKIPVIILATNGNVDDAINFMKNGALYYYGKDKINYPKVIDQICQGVKLYECIKPIITRSRLMRPVFQAIGKIAPTNKLVLLRGETGVGKELIAKAIHDMSGRRGEYVPMNIAAIDKMLFTDALFGHVKGAFDGAKEKRNGFIAKAQDGTLFMDEIGDMDCESQTSLLRILKDGTYYKVGSEEIIKSNTRIIAATNINIEQKIACGNYREDFFQQLKSFIINIPPLRERKEDIPLLIEYFIEKAVDNFQKNKIVPDREFIKKLSTYDLKGNVRELKHLIEELILKFQGCERLTVKMLDEISKNKELYSISLDSPFSIITEVNRKIGEGNYPSFMEIEAGYLKEVLLKSGSNYAQAAKFAGLSQRTFIYRLQTIKKKLNVMGLDFETFPKLSELIKRFH